MLASWGCFFAQLSYSLRTARLATFLSILAAHTQISALRTTAKHDHMQLAMLG
jgi:hypothetical protein